MMMQEHQPLRVSGSKVTPDIQMDSNVTNAVRHLRQDLAAKQTENQKLTDQLNCLVSLIKRSWSGDKHATLHLSNIVGMEPPECLDVNDGRDTYPSLHLYPSPLAKARWEKNWERLTVKLLNREYLSVQQEIREYQQQYIENRQAYMDAVLQDHQQNMSRIPLHHKSDPVGEEMDANLAQYSKIAGSGVGGKFRLVQSAGYHRKLPANDAVEKMEVSLRDLVGENSSSVRFISDQALNEPRILKPSSSSASRRPLSSILTRHLPPNTYNDPGRYTQGNLFALSEMDGIKRPRPVISSTLKNGDNVRSRPRSGRFIYKSYHTEQTTEKPVFITQKNERPLKYETTHPVRSKSNSAKRRGSSADGANKRAANEVKAIPVLLTNVINASSKTVVSTPVTNSPGDDLSSMRNTENFIGDETNEDIESHHDKNDEETDNAETSNEASTKPATIRAKSAFQRRPTFIDEFAQDEQNVKDMQEDFKKTAVSLQKKLGIRDSGIVTYN
uniref:Uncharacterized protein n=1 Tax=Arion vulgaris TaxID=1028688 RepID=A0A0B6XYW6_9EUPU